MSSILYFQSLISIYQQLHFSLAVADHNTDCVWGRHKRVHRGLLFPPTTTLLWTSGPWPWLPCVCHNPVTAHWQGSAVSWGEWRPLPARLLHGLWLERWHTLHLLLDHEQLAVCLPHSPVWNSGWFEGPQPEASGEGHSHHFCFRTGVSTLDLRWSSSGGEGQGQASNMFCCWRPTHHHLWRKVSISRPI